MSQRGQLLTWNLNSFRIVQHAHAPFGRPRLFTSLLSCCTTVTAEPPPALLGLPFGRHLD